MFGRTSRSRSRFRQSIHFGGSAAWKLPSRPLLLRATDAIVVLLAVVFPFIMGGREAWGHRTLITLALTLGFVWCLHQCRTGGRLRLTAMEPLAAAGLLLVWFQTVPLTPEALGNFSGEYARLLPYWAETQIPQAGRTAPAAWSTVSLIPTETQHALLILLAYLVIAVVVTQRLSTEHDCHNLLKLTAVSGLLMAAFAVLQLVTSNDRFFWFYQQPYTGTSEILKGAFSNRNHFAQFLSLSLGPLIWWLLAGNRNKPPAARTSCRNLGPVQGNHSHFDRVVDPKSVFLVCAIGGILLSIMLSLSRGGMISAGLVSVVCLAGLWKSGKVNASLAIVIVAPGIICVGGLLAFGQEKVEERVSQLATGDADKIDQMNARRTIWKADIEAIQAFPLLGTGVGSHRYIYPVYMEELADFADVTFSHAESSYIHLALETGLVGLGLLGSGLLFVFSRLVWNVVRKKDAERSAALAAVAAALAGGIGHAAVDFIWYVPAIVVSTIMLCVAGLRLCSGFHSERSLCLPRAAWLMASLACLLLLCRSQPELARRVEGERLWFQYLIATLNNSPAARDEASEAELADFEAELDGLQKSATTTSPTAAANAASGNDDHPAAHTTDRDVRIKALRDNIGLLMASLNAYPQQTDAALHLATRSRDLFELFQQESENSLPLGQIRDAVLASAFPDTAEMHRFLKRAFGNPVRLLLLSDLMARRSLAICPVRHNAYELLVSTAFVRDPQDQLHEHLITEALTLGENSPATRHAIGLARLLEGNLQEAMTHWAIVFHSNRQMRLGICSILAKRTAVDIILNYFHPTLDELDEVLAAYSIHRRKPDIEKLVYVIREHARGTKFMADKTPHTDHDQLLVILMEAYRAAYDAGLLAQSEELLRIAIECAPGEESPRRALGLLLYDLQRYEQAAEHFAWCIEQSPGDTRLEDQLRECRRRSTNQALFPTRSVSYPLIRP